jgi:hypothetical protein
MSDVTIQSYSDKSIIVQGDFETYAKQMKRFQARWNPRLKVGAGWLVPLEFESAVRAHFGVEEPQDVESSQRFKPAPVRRRVQPREPIYEDEELPSPPPRSSRVAPIEVAREVPRSSRVAPIEVAREVPRSVVQPREVAREVPRSVVQPREVAPRVPVVVNDDDDIVSLARKMSDMMRRLEMLENH